MFRGVPRGAASPLRRGGRVVECGGLENRLPLHGVRGFESLLLRHMIGRAPATGLFSCEGPVSRDSNRKVATGRWPVAGRAAGEAHERRRQAARESLLLRHMIGRAPATGLFSCEGPVSRDSNRKVATGRWPVAGRAAGEAHERRRQAARESLLLRHMIGRAPATGLFSCEGPVSRENVVKARSIAMKEKRQSLPCLP